MPNTSRYELRTQDGGEPAACIANDPGTVVLYTRLFLAPTSNFQEGAILVMSEALRNRENHLAMQIADGLGLSLIIDGVNALGYKVPTVSYIVPVDPADETQCESCQ